MANVNANVTELIKLLDIMSDEQNIMLVGNHGIGKSEILTEYFSAKGMPVIALFLGQMSDPGDLIGIPTKNEVTGKTDFMPPYWFPLDGKPIVLFLDELNRARPEVLQTIMDLALNRKLAGRRLPEGSRIISAVNEGNQYQLTDLDPALVSRFNIINFRPSVQEWLLWARRCKCDPRLLSFIEENAIWLDRDPDAKEGADTGLMKNPDRRGWKRVSDIISGRDELGPIFQKAISSIVGVKAASAFLTSLSSARLLSGKEVLMHLDDHLQTLPDIRFTTYRQSMMPFIVIWKSRRFPHPTRKRFATIWMHTSRSLQKRKRKRLHISPTCMLARPIRRRYQSSQGNAAFSQCR